MDITIEDFDVYVFDLDGTLYDQPKMRLKMAMKLATYYLLHISRVGDMLIIQKFRKLKDKWKVKSQLDIDYDGKLDSVDVAIADSLAKGNTNKRDKICGVIEKWIYEEPLSVIYQVRDKILIDQIEELREKGKKVVIFSDYPAERKMDALFCEVDAIYSSSDETIGELKPSPKGLNLICDDLKVNKCRVVMIGDRMEKDGQAAINAGIAYYILPRKINTRKIRFR